MKVIKPLSLRFAFGIVLVRVLTLSRLFCSSERVQQMRTRVVHSRVIRSCADDVLYSCHTQHATPCGSAGPGPADRSSETFTNPFLMSHVQYTTWSCHPNQPRQRGRCVAVVRDRASKSEWGEREKREREREKWSRREWSGGERRGGGGVGVGVGRSDDNHLFHHVIKNRRWR